MKIAILCTDRHHPIYQKLESWQYRNREKHDIKLLTRKESVECCDILFLISCNEVVGKDVIKKVKCGLVVHASDLPKDRGWSPHIWQILEGKNEITVSLLEIGEKVDSGDIWAQRTLNLEGHELYDEINEKLFSVELELMDYAVDNCGIIQPRPQDNVSPTYRRKRTPEDSRIDPNKTIAEQFDLMRVADPDRYPTFFDIRDCRYQIKVCKA